MALHCRRTIMGVGQQAIIRVGTNRGQKRQGRGRRRPAEQGAGRWERAESQGRAKQSRAKPNRWAQHRKRGRGGTLNRATTQFICSGCSRLRWVEGLRRATTRRHGAALETGVPRLLAARCGRLELLLVVRLQRVCRRAVLLRRAGAQAGGGCRRGRGVLYLRALPPACMPSRAAPHCKARGPPRLRTRTLRPCSPAPTHRWPPRGRCWARQEW